MCRGADVPAGDEGEDVAAVHVILAAGRFDRVL
jgi:hypothetical protein